MFDKVFAESYPQENRLYALTLGARGDSRPSVSEQDEDDRMLSEQALEFARVLRNEIGPDKKGIGPGNQEAIIVLWGDRDPSDLRPVLDELDALGFIRLDRGMGTGRAETKFGIRDIAGLAVLEPLQAYFDELEQ